MARTMGRGSAQVGGRGNAQAGDRGVDRGIGRGVHRGVGKGSSQASSLAFDRGFVRGFGSQGSGLSSYRPFEQGGGIGSNRGGSIPSDHGVSRGGGIGSSRGGGIPSDIGVSRGGGIGSSRGGGILSDIGVSRGGGICSSRGGGIPSDHGVSRGGGIGSSRGGRIPSDHGVSRGEGDGDAESVSHVVHSIIEGSDGDEESHVAPVRRGRASQRQVPEQINREWIYIRDGEFSNQMTSTRTIGEILRAFWSGPWESWRDVPTEHRTRLFERFKSYFQWVEKYNTQIYRCWENCIAGKFPRLLKRVRDEAIEKAIEKGEKVGDDMSVLIDYKPPWIKSETWNQMIATWITAAWKEKSERNTRIRSMSTGGKHTLGSQTYMTAKRRAAKVRGRELSTHEMWKQSHCRKGSRPLDQYLTASSSLVSDVDLEENDQEENLIWVDDRAEETWEMYDSYLVEKYGADSSIHPDFDQDL